MMRAMQIRESSERRRLSLLLPPTAFERSVRVAGVLKVRLEFVEQASKNTARLPVVEDSLGHLLALSGLHALALNHLVGFHPALALKMAFDPVAKSGLPVNEAMGNAGVAVAGLADKELAIFGGDGITVDVCKGRQRQSVGYLPVGHIKIE